MKQIINDNIKLYIKSLREQPEEIRRHLLNLIMIVLGIVLFFFWLWSFRGNINNHEIRNVIENENNYGLGVFSDLKNSLTDSYESFKK